MSESKQAVEGSNKAEQSSKQEEDSSAIIPELQITPATTAASADAVQNQTMQRNDSKDTTVIIIGAGAAGLTAGYDCYRKKIPFLILEASSVLGGRLRKNDSLASFPIDMGGEWIHGSPDLLSKIVDDPQVQLDKVKTKPYYVKPFHIYNTKNGTWREIFFWDGNYQRFVNTTWYDFMSEYIAKDIQDKIVYECAVQKIDYNDDSSSVTVSCENNQVYEGSQVIVTVALPILKQLQFNPPLSKAKQSALDKITFEPGLKMFYKFRKSFYRRGVSFGGSDRHGEIYLWDESYLQNTNDCILGIFCYGGKAKNLVTLSDDQIKQHFLEKLDEMYKGLASEHYLDCVVCNWTNEPHVQGLYSSYRKGMRYCYELTRPLSDRVFFAGEAIPVDGASYGYVHGAALSGRKAVLDIEKVRNNEQIPTNWKAYGVHLLSLACCGLEHRLFFDDDD